MKDTKQSTFYLSRSRREILHQLLSQKVGNHSGIFYWQDGGSTLQISGRDISKIF